MLDTNIISDLIRNPQGRAAKRIAKVGEDNICTSIIVAAELRYGCAKSGSKRLLKAVEDLLGEINVLPFDVPADAKYGGIRSELEAAGTPIGGNDLLIAAHAYATGATIVTANTDEFKRMRGLNVENWLACRVAGARLLRQGMCGATDRARRQVSRAHSRHRDRPLTRHPARAGGITAYVGPGKSKPSSPRAFRRCSRRRRMSDADPL
jgi:tRNA(fMet)-specific endonuclease VapC